jgi:hypothetical protein
VTRVDATNTTASTGKERAGLCALHCSVQLHLVLRLLLLRLQMLLAACRSAGCETSLKCQHSVAVPTREQEAATCPTPFMPTHGPWLRSRHAQNSNSTAQITGVGVRQGRVARRELCAGAAHLAGCPLQGCP